MVHLLPRMPAGAATGHATIRPDWFGIIQTGYHGFNGFERQFEELGGRAIRWPGGLISETRPDIYDLGKPEVFDAAHLFRYDPARERPSLADMLAYSAGRGLPFSMVIPTERYAGRMEAGEAEVSDFVARLVSGHYGRLPADMTLEIGNEYNDLDAFDDRPDRYGELAARLVAAIAGVLDDPGLNPEGHDLRIAVQAGKFHDDNAAILGAFTPQALREVDEIVFHTLPISFDNFRDPGHRGGPDAGRSRVERIIDSAERWDREIRLAGGVQDLDIFISAWTVGSSANDPATVDLAHQDIGLRAAGTMLDMFAGFSVAGVDAAAAWGVHVQNINSFSHVEADNRLDITPSGAMFDLLSAELVGTAYVGDYGRQRRDDPFMAYHFAGPDRTVIYVAANDIDDGGETVILRFPQDRVYELVSVTSLSADRPSGAGDEARLHERPVVKVLDLEALHGSLRLPFDRDFEVVQVVLGARPGEGTPGLHGAPAGGLGDDLLARLLADDTLVPPWFAEPGGAPDVGDFTLDIAALPVADLLGFDAPDWLL